MKPEKPLNNNYLVIPVIIGILVTLTIGILFFIYIVGPVLAPYVK